MLNIVGDHGTWFTYLADSWNALALTTAGLCLRIVRRRITCITIEENSLTIEFDIEGLFGGRRREKKAKHKAATY